MSTDSCDLVFSVDPNTHFGKDISWCRTHKRLAAQCGEIATIASLRQEVEALREALENVVRSVDGGRWIAIEDSDAALSRARDLTEHTAGKCEKIRATGASYQAVEWCHTHQRPWDACTDKRTIALLLESLKEARMFIGDPDWHQVAPDLIARIDAATGWET